MKPFETFKKRGSAQSAGLYYASKRNYAARDTTAVDDLTSLAWGTITFASNPGSSDTITLGGTAVTFGPGHNVAIGATLAITLASLATFLNASANVNLVKSTYTVTDTVLQIKYKLPGIETFTLAASVATRSAATLQLVQIKKRAAL